MACIVPAAGAARDLDLDVALANELFDWCNERLAYFKAPGWIVFLDSLPTTGTQKVQKQNIFPDGQNPTQHPDAIDLRSRKRRKKR